MADQNYRKEQKNGELTAGHLRKLLVGLPDDAAISVVQNDLDDYRNKGQAHWSFEATWTPVEPMPAWNSRDGLCKFRYTDSKGSPWGCSLPAGHPDYTGFKGPLYEEPGTVGEAQNHALVPDR